MKIFVNELILTRDKEWVRKLVKGFLNNKGGNHGQD